MFTKNLFCSILIALTLVSSSLQVGIKCTSSQAGDKCFMYYTREWNAMDSNNYDLQINPSRANIYYVITETTSTKQIFLKAINVNTLIQNAGTRQGQVDFGFCPNCIALGNNCWNRVSNVDSTLSSSQYSMNVVYCNAPSSLSKSTLGQNCPGSKIEMLTADSGLSEDIKLFVPYIRTCINQNQEEIDDIPRMIHTSVNIQPVSTIICRGGYSTYKFNGQEYSMSAPYGKTPQGKIFPLSNPMFYNQMSCASQSGGLPGAILELEANTNGWKFGKYDSLVRGIIRV